MKKFKLEVGLCPDHTPVEEVVVQLSETDYDLIKKTQAFLEELPVHASVDLPIGNIELGDTDFKPGPQFIRVYTNVLYSVSLSKYDVFDEVESVGFNI